jgi:hypothetical protein
MSAHVRVTWIICPRCGLSAAVGWRDGVLVAVDCPSGCRLTAANLARRGAKECRYRPPVPREATVGAVARAVAGPNLLPGRSDR